MGFVFDDQHAAHAIFSGTVFSAGSLSASRGNVSRQFQDNRGAVSFAQALGKDAATVLLGDGANDEQTEARAFHLRQ